jgi:hypothetical protein
MNTEAPARKEGGSKFAKFLLGAAVVVILYALSIGPAVALNKRGVISVDVLESVYTPLMMVMSAVPGGQRVTESYMTLWGAPQ